MAKSRESAGRRQREQAKREKANAKRERRLARSESEAEAAADAGTDVGEVVDEAALLAELEQLHTAYDNEEVSWDDFEARRSEILAKLQIG
jgi:hypothetical protein